MMEEWWGYAAFVNQGMGNKISRKRGWPQRKINQWYFMGTGHTLCRGRHQDELGIVAVILGMPQESFIEMLECHFRGDRGLVGYECKDGLLVHPTAIFCVVEGIVKKGVRKATQDILESLGITGTSEQKKA